MKFAIFLFTVMAFSTSAYATPTPAVQAEIDHLLTTIGSSQCQFIRNGKSHSPDEARAHIEKKFNHYKKRIDSAEEFIKYSATKSLISRKRYRVQCQGVESDSAEWLLSELEAHREQQNKDLNEADDG